MKKVVLSIACIMSVAFLYDVSAMRGSSSVARRTSNTAGRNQVVQANPISKIIPAVGQSDRAYIVKRTLSFVNATYISKAKQKLDAIIREMQASNGNQVTIKQMKTISNDLNRLLQSKNTVCGLINVKKENFNHPFTDVNDALLAGVLYMLKYVDTNKLDETSRLSSQLSTSLSDRNEKLLFSQVSSALRDLANIIKSLEEQLETFIDNTDDKVIERIDDSPQDSEESPAARTAVIPVASWSKLRNLSAASAAFLEESRPSVTDLSSISDSQELLEGMQNNLNTISSEGKPALYRAKLSRAKRTLADSIREFPSVTYANKIKMIDEAVSDYNEVASANTTLTAIEDTKQLKAGVITGIFDDMITSLEKIRKEGNLQGAFATAVNSSLNTAKANKASFINSSTSVAMKKMKLRGAIASFNSAMNRLKNRVAFDDEWADLLSTTIKPIETADANEVLGLIE